MIKSFSFWSLNLLCKVIDLMKPIFTYGFTSACFGNIGSLGNWNQCLWNFFCNQQKIPKGWSPLSDHAKIPISTKVIRIHLSLFWLLGITWETGPTFTKAKGNLNLLPAYAPHGPIPPPPSKFEGGKILVQQCTGRSLAACNSVTNYVLKKLIMPMGVFPG